MSSNKYYELYEQRYSAAFAAGVDRWGHSPQDEGLCIMLESFVQKHQLHGKRIIEFACGEGGAGVILSRLGCMYHGLDIAPSAIDKARSALAEYPTARVTQLDMVCQRPSETYDAALIVMGLHMLITDDDRTRCLHNAWYCLAQGAPLLLFREMYDADAYDRPVNSLDEWRAISKVDYDTPQVRTILVNSVPVKVMLPFLPARPRNEKQFRQELNAAGFSVKGFWVNETSEAIQCSATIECVKG